LSGKWVFSVAPENWAIVKDQRVWAVESRRARDKVELGDHLIFYVTRSKPPAFMGIFKVLGDWHEAKEPLWHDEMQSGKVLYPWQIAIEPVQLGAVDYKALSRQLSFVENKRVWFVYMMGTPANFGRPIHVKDYELIFREMLKPPISVEFLQKRPVKREVKPRPVKVATLRKMPSHRELRDIVQEIGAMKGRISKVEYPLDDITLDVAWMRTPDSKPAWVFEVQIAGNMYQALAKLKHAWDIWNSKPFLVTNERYEKQANWLLGGTFHEIKTDMRIVNYRKIIELHRALKEAAAVESEINL